MQANPSLFSLDVGNNYLDNVELFDSRIGGSHDIAAVPASSYR